MNRRRFSIINMTTFTDVKIQSHGLVAYHHVKWKLTILQNTVLNWNWYSKIVLTRTWTEIYLFPLSDNLEKKETETESTSSLRASF